MLNYRINEIQNFGTTNIKEITQLHSGLVSIKLKNNSRIEGYQPKIDNVFSLVNCKNKIIFITE